MLSKDNVFKLYCAQMIFMTPWLVASTVLYLDYGVFLLFSFPYVVYPLFNKPMFEQARLLAYRSFYYKTVVLNTNPNNSTIHQLAHST